MEFESSGRELTVSEPSGNDLRHADVLSWWTSQLGGKTWTRQQSNIGMCNKLWHRSMFIALFTSTAFSEHIIFTHMCKAHARALAHSHTEKNTRTRSCTLGENVYCTSIQHFINRLIKHQVLLSFKKKVTALRGKWGSSLDEISFTNHWHSACDRQQVPVEWRRWRFRWQNTDRSVSSGCDNVWLMVHR